MGRRQGREPIAVPDAELAVLKFLWQSGAATVREIAEVLYHSTDTSALATVQKLLDRLLVRKCVAKRRRGRSNIFSATIQRDDLIRERLREAAEKLCEGSFTPLLTQLVDARRFTKGEIDELRSLVNSLERKQKR